MEAIGGELNAYTSRENTCFVTHSLKEHLGLSLDVLCDLVSSPTFSRADIEKEKQVVIQEIHMSDDMLEEAIFDLYFEHVYKGSTLGLPILGTVKSIENTKRSIIMEYYKRQYTAENIIVSVAGNMKHEDVVRFVEKHLRPNKPSKAKTPNSREDEPRAKSFREVVRRHGEQAHMLIGFPSGDIRDRLRFEAFIVNSALGGGMTSRLYQEIREERGLVYSIHSQLSTFMDAGLNLVYAGTEAKHMPDVVEITLKELKKLKKLGLKKSDVELFKTQVKGSILLGADDVENRMNSIGINEMVFGKYRSVDDVMYDVEAVTPDTVHEYIETRMDLDNLSILLMGALPEAPTKKWLQSF
jgi:predicted Zn-dependent peptidase